MIIFLPNDDSEGTMALNPDDIVYVVDSADLVISCARRDTDLRYTLRYHKETQKYKTARKIMIGLGWVLE